MTLGYEGGWGVHQAYIEYDITGVVGLYDIGVYGREGYIMPRSGKKSI